jgi:hypothetical protein
MIFKRVGHFFFFPRRGEIRDSSQKTAEASTTAEAGLSHDLRGRIIHPKQQFQFVKMRRLCCTRRQARSSKTQPGEHKENKPDQRCALNEGAGDLMHATCPKLHDPAADISLACLSVAVQAPCGETGG